MATRTKRPKRPKRWTETDKFAAHVGRNIAALGRRVGAEQPENIHLLVDVGEQIDIALADAVNRLREAAFTDGEIGRWMGGVTKQAVQQRFPREQA